MKPNYYLLLIIPLMFCSCGTKPSITSSDQLEELKQMVEEKYYRIVSDRAYPQVTSAMNSLQNTGLVPRGSSVGQIDLISIPNYVTIKGDSIFAELPYYGERQLYSGYNGSDNSVSVKGLYSDYSVTQNDKNNSYVIKIDAKSQTETIQFVITLFPNLKSSIHLNSTSRRPIRYSGQVSAL
ncbi:DUF4251 domain-containing protein [Psychroserpens sp. XS_ASV72]|uniref:DUF4251 domain-containing protein n=1 Tax=Psychroserpens sp. XS_ASV72 TaxID=3241293 RepID=UPI003513267F